MVVELGFIGPLSSLSNVLYSVLFALLISVWILAYKYSFMKPVFISILILGATTSGMLDYRIPPFTNLNKHTEPIPSETSFHQVYITDSEGDKLRLDRRSIQNRYIDFRTLEDKSIREKTKISKSILLKSKILRRQILNNETENFQFPPPTDSYNWNRKTIKNHQKFESIQIFRRTIKFYEDSYQIRQTERSPVLEYEEKG